MRTLLARWAVWACLLAACGYEPRLLETGDGDAGVGDGDATASADLVIENVAPFGNVVVGQSSAMSTFVIRNRGPQSSGAITVAVAGGTTDFVVAEDSCGGDSLDGGRSCIVGVVFSPASGGERTATIEVLSASGGSISAMLSGTGLAPCELAFDVSAHDFGPTAVAVTSAAHVLTLTNRGEATTGAIVVSLPPGAPYVISADACSGAMLTGDATCTITTAFRPAVVGTSSSAVTVGVPECITASSLGGTGTARVSVMRLGGGSGAITSNPAGIDCGATCAFDFSIPSVTLAAAVPAGQTFMGWGGACSGSGSCALALSAATSATATFETNKVLSVGRTGTGAGSVMSSITGISCGAQCTAAFAHGASVSLTPTPSPGSSFAGWSGGCSGTGSCVVTMTAARTVDARFESLVQPLTVAIAGGGSIVANPAGIACPSDCMEDYPHGATVNLTAQAATGWAFNGWSGGCAGSGACALTMSGPRAVTATFVLTTPSLTVTRSGSGSGTVTSTPAGISCGSSCTQPYSFGSMVTLVATAASGSSFAGWTGACSGTGSCVVTVDAARTVDARFDRDQHALAVTRAGAGVGSVSSVPAGIDCGTACTASFDEGSVVVLAATPAIGSQFAGWSGACTGTGTCTVTMAAARSVTATFAPVVHTLTVMKTGGNGTVTSNLTGIDCGTDCTEPYTYGTVVTLDAVPNNNSDFVGWSGACTGTSTCQVTMDQARSVTATFVYEINTLTVTKAGSGAGEVTSNFAGIQCGADCSEAYPGNRAITLTATPTPPAVFGGWGGSCFGTDPTCTLFMSSPHNVTATFYQPYALTVVMTGTGLVYQTNLPQGEPIHLYCSGTCSVPMTGTVTLIHSTMGAFNGWTGCLTMTSTTCTVFMDGPKTVTAAFAP